MRNLFLTKQQQRSIAYDIVDNLDFVSQVIPSVDFEFCIDDIIVQVKAHAEGDGYEEDYEDGTSSFVFTYACCIVDEITAYDDYDEFYVVYDAAYIEGLVESELLHC